MTKAKQQQMFNRMDSQMLRYRSYERGDTP